MKRCIRLCRALHTVSTSHLHATSLHARKAWTPLSANVWQGSFLNLHYARRNVVSSSVPTEKVDNDLTSSLEEEEDPLQHPDYFAVKDLVTLEDLFNARVHYGHKKGSRNEHMKPYFFGCRMDVDVFDLEQTLTHLRLALNVLAHIAYRKGIILFVMKSPKFGHMVEQLALDCEEYAHTRDWRDGTFTDIEVESNSREAKVRLPDVCVFLSSQGSPYQSHPAVNESAKVGILTIGVCDSNANPTIISYPIPGNDDSLQSIELYCRLFKEAVLRGKEKRIQADKRAERQKLAKSEQNDVSSTPSFLAEIEEETIGKQS